MSYNVNGFFMFMSSRVSPKTHLNRFRWTVLGIISLFLLNSFSLQWFYRTYLTQPWLGTGQKNPVYKLPVFVGVWDSVGWSWGAACPQSTHQGVSYLFQPVFCILCHVMFVEWAQGKAGHNKSHSFPSFTSLLPKRWRGRPSMNTVMRCVL
jgi:hypothetical protein